MGFVPGFYYKQPGLQEPGKDGDLC